MRLKKKFFLAFLLMNFTAFSQKSDSINKLELIEITAFRKTIPQIEATTSVAKINSNILQINNPERILEAVNLIPGSKIEERSPGSYRVSLRGSTLRSPFGVKNVKIYWDDFILTDATGNSYLNLLPPSFISNITVLKGPQGSEIGSETGGALLLNTNKAEHLSLDFSGGSYNQFSQNLNFAKQLGNHFLQIGQSHYQTDSYREQAAVNRGSFFLKDIWTYNPTNELKFQLLYTDLHYQTPGGLTLQQMQNNRRSARLATPTLPSAVQQNAGIYNKTILGGVSHNWKLSDNWSNFALVQTSYTDFKNPFISNFEFRKEQNFQGRFFASYKKQISAFNLETRFGTEAGQNKTDIKNYDNNFGTKGDAQKFDAIKTTSAFYYVSQHISWKNKLFIDASLSLNTMKYTWESEFSTIETGNVNFKKQWLPNFGINYKLKEDFSVRAKIAKGTSAPTTEEVRSSNQLIATNLMAEYGWNKEIGFRKKIGSLNLEATVFDYKLNDAIVRRQDANANDYFINAGGTKQFGVEFLVESKKYHFNHSVFNGLKFLVSATHYDFKYKDYVVNTQDFSENYIPGISQWALQSLVSLEIERLFWIDFSNYYNSKQFLNDANLVTEQGFLVGNVKANTQFSFSDFKLNMYLGVNNIYNTKYSAGYDLNAFGNRFYNPAAMTNFYIGCTFKL